MLNFREKRSITGTNNALTLQQASETIFGTGIIAEIQQHSQNCLYPKQKCSGNGTDNNEIFGFHKTIVKLIIYLNKIVVPFYGQKGNKKTQNSENSEFQTVICTRLNEICNALYSEPDWSLHSEHCGRPEP